MALAALRRRPRRRRSLLLFMPRRLLPLLFFFFFLCCSCLLLYAAAPAGAMATTTHPTDIAALMEIRAAVDAATIPLGSCLSTWDFSRDPCESLFGVVFSCGIACAVPDADSDEQQPSLSRIVSLKLDSAGYGGTLSPWVGNLTALQVVQLSGNSFRGPIPDSLASLQSLRFLDLSSNLFSGPFPPSIIASNLPSLQSLSLADNLLSGPLPPTFISNNNISQSLLLDLHLFGNSFTGSLPDFSSFRHLRLLDLSNNHFDAFYAYPLRHFPPAAVSLSLRNNRLAGELEGLELGPELSVLDLSGNNLSGAIDGALFFKHPALQQLNLSCNAFTSIIVGMDEEEEEQTSSWAMAAGIGGGGRRSSSNSEAAAGSELVAVDLSHNQIQGRLPVAFARMPKLASLSLSDNRFSGRIEMSYAVKAVAAMVGLQPLRRLMLDSNYLSGPLPPLFAKFIPQSIIASVVDNCLLDDACPPRFFFCQGAAQKPHSLCASQL